MRGGGGGGLTSSKRPVYRRHTAKLLFARSAVSGAASTIASHASTALCHRASDMRNSASRTRSPCTSRGKHCRAAARFPTRIYSRHSMPGTRAASSAGASRRLSRWRPAAFKSPISTSAFATRTPRSCSLWRQSVREAGVLVGLRTSVRASRASS